MRTIRAVILHHTRAHRKQTFEEIRTYHMRPVRCPEHSPKECPDECRFRPGRGWTDIGYHYLVRMGAVYPGRPIATPGSHCLGRNSDTIGIAVTGDYRDGSWPDEQDLDCVVGLVQMLEANLGHPLEVLGHSEAMAQIGQPDHTTCPGSDWPSLVRLRLAPGVGGNSAYIDDEEPASDR